MDEYKPLSTSSSPQHLAELMLLAALLLAVAAALF